MTERASQIEIVYFGEIQDMIAEVGAHDMGDDWFAEYHYTHCMLPMGNMQFDTEYFTSRDEAKQAVAFLVEFYGANVKTCSI